MNATIEAVPAGACDCHVHLFGPEAQYPFAAERVYTPGEADEAALAALHHRLGIARVVLVQPSPYGTDNRRLLAGLERLGPRARAVAVVDAGATPEQLSSLREAGVRGLRLNLDTYGIRDPRAVWPALEMEAARCAGLGWHVQVLTHLSVIEALADRLAGLPAPLVIDHFGRPDVDQPLSQPGFAALLRLVGSGRVWVKLSAIGRLCGDGRLERIAPFVKALAEAGADRLVWGSDWPHTGGGRGDRAAGEIEPFMALDDGEALAVLARTVGDAGLLHKILVENPAAFYGFEGVSA
jgi:predicted TIM-barrel fold metal-dependent hydrolase